MQALLGGIVGFLFGVLMMGFVWVLIELKASKVLPSVSVHKVPASIKPEAEAPRKPRGMDGHSLRMANAKANRSEYSTEVDDSGIA